jgi:hypothetical protein
MSVTFGILGENLTGAAFRDILRDADRAAKGIESNFNRAFAGLSVAGALAGVVALGKRAIETGDELGKAAIKAGVSGRAISELAFAARMSDVDLGSLSTSLRFMQKNLSEAGTGAQAPITALAALGLRVEELQGLKADEQFEILADRIAALQNPADRARAATELFGRAGAELLPLFEQGAEGIRKAREEAQRLGLSFSDEQLGALGKADDAIKRLAASWDGFATTLTAKVAPALSGLLTSIQAITTGDEVAKLQEQIDFLQRMQGRSFVSAGYGDIGTGFFTAAEGAAKLLELEDKLARMQAGPSSMKGAAGIFAPGAKAAATAPGYTKGPDEAAAKRAAAEAAAAAKVAADEAQAAQNRMLDLLGREVAARERMAELAVDAGDAGAAELQAELAAGAEQQLETAGIAIDATLERMKAEGEAVALTFDAMLEPLSRGFGTVLEGVLLGTQTMQQAFARMGANVVAVFANMAGQAVINLLKMKLVALATGKTTALAELRQSAAVAAGNAYKAVVGIPIVGPALAPPAAALAYAGVLAFGAKVPSAAGGFDIPAGANPLTQLHEKEMVLPAKYADAIRQMTETKEGRGDAPPIVELRGVSAGDFFVASRADLIRVLNQGRRDFALGY